MESKQQNGGKLKEQWGQRARKVADCVESRKNDPTFRCVCTHTHHTTVTTTLFSLGEVVVFVSFFLLTPTAGFLIFDFDSDFVSRSNEQFPKCAICAANGKSWKSESELGGSEGTAPDYYWGGIITWLMMLLLHSNTHACRW